MYIKLNVKIRPYVLVEHVGFSYLAVIQNGMQIGALAQTPDGRYVQVNGAVVQPLNRFKVLRALKRESTRRERYRNPSRHIAAPVVSVLPKDLDTEHRIERPATAPVVSVRRRRRLLAEAPHE